MRTVWTGSREHPTGGDLWARFLLLPGVIRGRSRGHSWSECMCVITCVAVTASVRDMCDHDCVCDHACDRVA